MLIKDNEFSLAVPLLYGFFISLLSKNLKIFLILISSFFLFYLVKLLFF